MNIEKNKLFFSNKRNWQILCKRSSSQTFWKFCIKNLICAEICFCLCSIHTVAKWGQLLLGFPIIWYVFLLNWNVFRVYRLRATLWSTLWELIGGQRSRQLSDPRLEKTKSGRIHQSREDCGTGLDSLCLFYADRLQMSQFASDLSCSKCPPLCSKYKWISRALFKRVCWGKHSIASFPPAINPKEWKSGIWN